MMKGVYVGAAGVIGIVFPLIIYAWFTIPDCPR